MSEKSKIEWTDSTWTPIRARVKQDAKKIATEKGYTSLLPILKPGKVGPHCEHASDGCKNCYSETNNHRGLPTNGTGLPFDRRSRDLVDMFVDEKILLQPLKWKKPRKIFVCSQTDLFAEFVTDEMIDCVFAMMGICHQHTFQVLTKRPDRMKVYFAGNPLFRWIKLYWEWLGSAEGALLATLMRDGWSWAGAEVYVGHLENVWLGVSVEDQPNANKRIPDLLATPAAVRFLSYEPALGPIDLEYPEELYPNGAQMCCGGFECGCQGRPTEPPLMYGLDWIIIGGESGPGARPLDVRWVSQLISLCHGTTTAVFVKQLGAKPMMNGKPYNPHGVRQNDLSGKPFGVYDRKGGLMSEWPEDLRVRQMPGDVL